jgi:3-deoxy-manno-octulosonate cytidylyltransferase (CMP-KDO synthetase)
MALIAGRSMLERIWRIARAVRNIDQIWIATDDSRIFDFARQFGAQAVMTPESCRNGTERALAAIQSLSVKPDIVINFQGDAVLTPPWILQPLVDEMRRDPSIQIATPAVSLSWEQLDELQRSKGGSPSAGTLVTFDRSMNALYFSKSIIPFVRSRRGEKSPAFRHIGMYAYRADALTKYLSLKPGPLEESEGLEQLRALENGMPIKVIEVDYKGRTHWSVDTPEDIPIVEEIIRREGELV